MTDHRPADDPSRAAVPPAALHDAKVILGIPPHDAPSNGSRGCGYFGLACETKYGRAVWQKALRMAKESK